MWQYEKNHTAIWALNGSCKNKTDKNNNIV
jgi:hypothetical protein